MAWIGGEAPPSTDAGAWLAITWESASSDAVEVDLIVDVVERYPGITPPSPPPEPEPSEPIELAQPEVPGADDEAGRDEPQWLPIGSALGLLALLAGGAWWWRRRRV